MSFREAQDYESPIPFVYVSVSGRSVTAFPVALSIDDRNRPYADPGRGRFRTGCGEVEEAEGSMETEHRTTAEPNFRDRNWRHCDFLDVWWPADSGRIVSWGTKVENSEIIICLPTG